MCISGGGVSVMSLRMRWSLHQPLLSPSLLRQPIIEFSAAAPPREEPGITNLSHLSTRHQIKAGRFQPAGAGA